MIKKITLIALLSLPLLSAETRVVNGNTVTDDNELWRFIAALKNDEGQYCGGSIIKERWILTAAHCLTDEEGNPNPVYNDDRVGVGAYNIYNMTDYTIKRYIVHPDYDADTTDNDIALVELNKNITNIAPIVYDTSHSLEEDSRTMLAGWGYTDRDGASATNDLQEATLPIIDYETCNSETSYDGELTTNMFCAGFMDGRSDGCQGDSGGPLIVDNTLVGIVSWGDGCAQENFPGVYTRVQNYDAWIKKITKKVVPKPKPTKPSLWIPIIMGDLITFAPNLVAQSKQK